MRKSERIRRKIKRLEIFIGGVVNVGVYVLLCQLCTIAPAGGGPGLPFTWWHPILIIIFLTIDAIILSVHKLTELDQERYRLGLTAEGDEEETPILRDDGRLSLVKKDFPVGGGDWSR